MLLLRTASMPHMPPDAGRTSKAAACHLLPAWQLVPAHLHTPLPLLEPLQRQCHQLGRQRRLQGRQLSSHIGLHTRKCSLFVGEQLHALPPPL